MVFDNAQFGLNFVISNIFWVCVYINKLLYLYLYLSLCVPPFISLFAYLPSLELYFELDIFAECFVCSQLVFLCHIVYDLCDGNSKAVSKYALVKCIQFFVA